MIVFQPKTGGEVTVRTDEQGKVTVQAKGLAANLLLQYRTINTLSRSKWKTVKIESEANGQLILGHDHGPVMLQINFYDVDKARLKAYGIEVALPPKPVVEEPEADPLSYEEATYGPNYWWG